MSPARRPQDITMVSQCCRLSAGLTGDDRHLLLRSGRESRMRWGIGMNWSEYFRVGPWLSISATYLTLTKVIDNCSLNELSFPVE